MRPSGVWGWWPSRLTVLTDMALTWWIVGWLYEGGALK